MESFGRVVAIALAAIGTVFFLWFGRAWILYRSRENAIMTVLSDYVAYIKETGKITPELRNKLQEEIGEAGVFQVDWNVWLYCDGEGEQKTQNQYTFQKPDSDTQTIVLNERSLFRLNIREKTNDLASFLWDGGVFVTVGGRMGCVN